MRHRSALIFSLVALVLVALWLLRPRTSPSDPRRSVIEAGSVRIGPESPREWADADPRPIAGARYEKTFSAAPSEASKILSLQQEGVKRNWGIFLNDRKLGTLVPDETTIEHLV